MEQVLRTGSVLLFLSLFVADVCYAQLLGPGGKEIDVIQVEEAPIIDGVLDDKAWEFATVIEDLHEVNPDEFDPPSERTTIYVVYTRDALYIAARFWDSEPDRISAQTLRQGDFSYGEDSITVMLDPFNNDRSGYAFDLTANAVRNQALYANVTSENWSWDGIWHGDTVIDDKGWVAEIEIPFMTISFDPDNETWGLNFARYIGRKTEHIGWVSANRTQNPAVSGHMTGMHGMQQGMGLDVVPGFRLRRSTDYENNLDENEFVPSIDFFYKLTPALTAALTVNTDFSGTGADYRQINLTRFGLFFPERRGFFLQDTDIFEFGKIGDRDYSSISTLSRVEEESGRPFFSRRIGLSDTGEALDINVGGKLTGRAGRWDIGMLAIRQDGFENVEQSDLFVARIAANVLEESSVGMILTHGDPNSNLDNTVAGLDFRYLKTGMSNGGTLEGSFWYQESETEGLHGDNSAWGVSVGMPNAIGFRYKLAYKELQENYYPALGFVNRTDVGDMAAVLGYTWYPQSDFFRTVYAGVDFERIDTLGGDLQSQLVTLRPLELTTQSNDNISLHYHLIDENLVLPWEISEGIIIPAGEYSFDQYCINGRTASFRKLSASGFYCDGDFYDGSQLSTGIDLLWRPNEHFKFTAGYAINDIELPNGAFITRLITARADIAFTNAWYWENFVQYDNVSYSLGFNSIIGWIPRAGRRIIFVVNREFIDYTHDRDFTKVSGDVTLKLNYTFRF